MSHYQGLVKNCINTGQKVHLFATKVCARGYTASLLESCLSRRGFIQRSVRDIIKKVPITALRCPFQIWFKRMDHDLIHSERREESVAKAISSNNRCNQQLGVPRKNPNNSLKIQEEQSKAKIKKNTFVGKSNKMNKTTKQSK